MSTPLTTKNIPLISLKLRNRILVKYQDLGTLVGKRDVKVRFGYFEFEVPLNMMIVVLKLHDIRNQVVG